jgi:PAS domain S-box-containing protein
MNKILVYSILLFWIINLQIHSGFCQDNTEKLDSLLLKVQENKEYEPAVLEGLAQRYLEIDPQRAIKYARKYLSVYKNDSAVHKNLILSLMGEAYNQLGKYDSSLTYYYKCLSSYKADEKNKEKAKIYHKMGVVYYNLKNDEKAIDYFKKSLEMNVEVSDTVGISKSLNSIASIYFSENKLNKTQRYLERSLELSSQIKDTTTIVSILNNLGLVAKKRGEYQKALEYYRRSIKLKKLINDKNGISYSLLNIGNLYAEQGKYSLALSNYNRGFKIAKNLEIKKLESLYLEALSDNYKKMGNISRAYEFLQKHLEVREELLNEKNQEKIAELETRFQLKQKENEIEILSKERALQKANLKKQKLIRNIIIGVFAFLLVLVILLYRSVANKRKTNSILRDKNEEIEVQSKILEEKNEELNKLSLVARETDNVIIITNSKGIIEWGNDAIKRLYGIDIERVKGKNIFKTSTCEDINNIKKKLFQFKKSISYESYIKSGGKIFYQQSTMTPILDSNGEIDKIIVVDSDITSQKEVEKELKKKRAELERANATKDRFFSIIAHDLKNPFNSLLGLSEMLVSKRDKLSEEKIKSFEEGIYNLSKQGYDLLSNLLEWSRAQLNRIEMEVNTLNLKKQVDYVTGLNESRAKGKEIEIKTEIPQDLLIRADENMLRTVLRNLISNAIKFTRPGGWVQIEAYSKNETVYIEIIDNGVGIPDNKLDTIFNLDESYRTEGTNKEKGTGLGLILCKEFIDKHNGNISVQSEVGNGTRFTVLFPGDNN